MLDTLVIPCHPLSFRVLHFSHAIHGPFAPTSGFNILCFRNLKPSRWAKMPPSASRHWVGWVVQQVPWYGLIPVADGVSEVELASLKPKEVENDRKSLFSDFFRYKKTIIIQGHFSTVASDSLDISLFFGKQVQQELVGRTCGRAGERVQRIEMLGSETADAK